MKQKILITGGTGLIGSQLSVMLLEQGHEVRVLSRKEDLQAVIPRYGWDYKNRKINPAALVDIDSVIHLAGAGIADKRWTPQRKREILSSRVDSTLFLRDCIAELPIKPRSFIACSAIGIYGDRGDEITDERHTTSDNSFLIDVCKKWENAALQIETLGIRIPIIRVGIVLSTKGGALEQLIKSFQFRVGGYFGSGNNYMPWIHMNDICRVFIEAVTNDEMKGPYNAVSPNPCTAKALTHAIGKATKKGYLAVPAPAFVAKLMLGEMAAVILNINRVVPTRLLEMSFPFKYEDLGDALYNTLHE